MIRNDLELIEIYNKCHIPRSVYEKTHEMMTHAINPEHPTVWGVRSVRLWLAAPVFLWKPLLSGFNMIWTG